MNTLSALAPLVFLALFILFVGLAVGISVGLVMDIVQNLAAPRSPEILGANESSPARPLLSRAAVKPAQKLAGPPKLFLQNEFRVADNEKLPAPVVVYSDIAGSSQYTSRDPNTRKNQHIGQRKLFLSELQFMTRHTRGNPALIVYAGGAPSNKIAFLAELFPAAWFLLVDPNIFSVFPPTYWDRGSPYRSSSELPRILIPRGSGDSGLSREKIDTALDTLVGNILAGASQGGDPSRSSASQGDPSRSSASQGDPRSRIFIINTIYTPEHSIAIRQAVDTVGLPVYFFSDIRTNISQELFPRDLDITWNMAQQYLWSSLLRPEATMMKWRRPFYQAADETIFLWDQVGSETLGGPAEAIVSMGPAERKKIIYQAPTRTRQPADIPDYVAADFELSRAGSYTDSRGVEHGFPQIDFPADYAEQTLRYPVGEVYIQPYAGMVSAETRLVFKKDAPVITHPGPAEYDSRLFYYNSVARAGPRKVSAISEETKKAARGLHLDNCNDCALESLIWEEYLVETGQAGMGPSRGTLPQKICQMMALLVAATENRQLHVAANIKTYIRD